MPTRTRATLTLAAALALTGLGATPAVAGPAAPDVPTEIAVAGDVKPFLVGHAVGWQVHTCKPTATGYAWAFDGPVAALYADNGQLVATHSSGPTWSGRDGSWVRAEVTGRATVSATAIPWLKLRAPDAAAGTDGSRLARTAFIQRIATTGGLTPAASECTAATAGQTRYVDYTADYVFWKATATS